MTIRLWNVATGTNTATLVGHTDGINTVAFSPDGTMLASGAGANDPSIRLWDVSTGENSFTFQGHTNEVLSVAFSPDGTILASGAGANDPSVRLWDVASRKPFGILQGHENWVNSVAFSPDGTFLASGSDDRTIRIWDTRTATHTATLKHSTWVKSLAISPDGTILASASEDGMILLWDMQYVLSHPLTLTKLSGDEQQGAPNSTLDDPFIVEVRDQNGKEFEGAQVIFAIATGGGDSFDRDRHHRFHWPRLHHPDPWHSARDEHRGYKSGRPGTCDLHGPRRCCSQDLDHCFGQRSAGTGRVHPGRFAGDFSAGPEWNLPYIGSGGHLCRNLRRWDAFRSGCHHRFQRPRCRYPDSWAGFGDQHGHRNGGRPGAGYLHGRSRGYTRLRRRWGDQFRRLLPLRRRLRHYRLRASTWTAAGWWTSATSSFSPTPSASRRGPSCWLWPWS